MGTQGGSLALKGGHFVPGGAAHGLKEKKDEGERVQDLVPSPPSLSWSASDPLEA